MGKAGPFFLSPRPQRLILKVMRTVDLAPEKQISEVKTRRLRNLRYSQGSYSDRNPSLKQEGKWLRNAGFRSGNCARFILPDSELVIRCEKSEEELQKA